MCIPHTQGWLTLIHSSSSNMQSVLCKSSKYAWMVQHCLYNSNHNIFLTKKSINKTFHLSLLLRSSVDRRYIQDSVMLWFFALFWCLVIRCEPNHTHFIVFRLVVGFVKQKNCKLVWCYISFVTRSVRCELSMVLEGPIQCGLFSRLDW